MTMFTVILPLLALASVAFAARLPNLSPAEFEEYKKTHRMEFSGKFEGDMVVRPSFRNQMIGTMKWYNGHVYYDYSAMDSTAQTWILNALNNLEKRVGSCLKFIQRPQSMNSYIRVINGGGCYSSVGRIGYPQDLSLGGGCLSQSTIQHEFLHAIGFMHEQSRSDRDNYLRINWQNIKNGMSYNFNKENTNNQGLPYDYKSVMHYSGYAFSKNGQPTMEAKDETIKRLTGWNELTDRDVKMIQKYYGCTGNSGGSNGGGAIITTTTTTKKPVVDNCFDKITNGCQNWTHLCNIPSYKRSMERDCRKTCGFC